MQTVELNIKSRNQTGSRYARNLRRAGLVPAILYGHGMAPLPLQVSARDLYKVLHTKAGENVIVQLKPEEGIQLQESTCVIKDIQHHPVTDEIDHVDFTVISLSEKIEVSVPIVVKGEVECPGLKAGGVLDLVHHELDVVCLPTEIPEAIYVNIKTLEIADAIHVKELDIPQGVEVNKDHVDEDDVIVTIHPPRMEEAPKEAGAEAPAQPEVIEKGKKPEEAAE